MIFNKMEDLNKKISLVRSEYELTQTEFGERIGVSRAHIAALESGRYKPSKKLLEKIYKEFNLNENVFKIDIVDFVDEVKILNPEHKWLTYPTKTELKFEKENIKLKEMIELLRENNGMLKEKISALESRLSDCQKKQK